MANHRHSCPHCQRTFMAAAKAPTSCGRVYCRAMAEYTDADWAGAARMARARKATGLALSPLDNEALRRSPQ